MSLTPTAWFEGIGAVSRCQRQITTSTRQLIVNLQALAHDPAMTTHEQANLATAIERWETILSIVEQRQPDQTSSPDRGRD